MTESYSETSWAPTGDDFVSEGVLESILRLLPEIHQEYIETVPLTLQNAENTVEQGYGSSTETTSTALRRISTSNYIDGLIIKHAVLKYKNITKRKMLRLVHSLYVFLGVSPQMMSPSHLKRYGMVVSVEARPSDVEYEHEMEEKNTFAKIETSSGVFGKSTPQNVQIMLNILLDMPILRDGQISDECYSTRFLRALSEKADLDCMASPEESYNLMDDMMCIFTGGDTSSSITKYQFLRFCARLTTRSPVMHVEFPSSVISFPGQTLCFPFVCEIPDTFASAVVIIQDLIRGQGTDVSLHVISEFVEQPYYEDSHCFANYSPCYLSSYSVCEAKIIAEIQRICALLDVKKTLNDVTMFLRCIQLGQRN